MSCNTKTSLAAVIDAVNAQLNNNYIDRDDPRINQGVFTEPTIRGGLMLDEAAKLDFCGYVNACGLSAPFGKQWIDRPLYPDNVLVSYDDGGEIKSRWGEARKEVTTVKDFGAIGDGIVDDTASIKRALQQCSDRGETLFFPSGVYKYSSSVALQLSKGITIEGNNAIILGGNISEFLAYSDNIHIKDIVFKEFFRVIYGAVTLERTTYKSMRIEGCTFFRCLRTIEVSAARGTVGATSAADISSLEELDIRNNIVDSCGNGIRIWRHILSGFVVNNRVTNIGNIIEDAVITTARGLDIGWDDLGYVPELHAIGSITATGNYVSKIYSVGTKARSMHGILILSPNTILSGNEVFGVYGKANESTHGLYVKGASVVIANNIIRDAGDGGFAVTIKPTYDVTSEVPKSEIKAVFTDNFIEFSASYATKERHGGIRSTGDNPTIISSNYIRGAVGSAITGSKNNTSITNNTIIDFKGSTTPAGYSSVVSLFSLTGTIAGNTITAYDRVGSLILFDINVSSTEAVYTDEVLLALNINNNTLKLKGVGGVSDPGIVYFINKLVSIASDSSLGVFSISNNQVTFPTGSAKKFRFLQQYNNNNQGTENLIIASNMTNLPPDNLTLSIFPTPKNRLEEHSNIQCGILSLGNPRIGNSLSYPSKVSPGFMYFDAEKDGLMIKNESGVWVDVKGRTVTQLRGLPVGDSSDRPTAAYTGKTFYSKTDKVMYVFDGTTWAPVAGVDTSVVKRSGTTAERPIASRIYPGFVYIDTDLGKPIIFSSTKWVDGTGATV